MSFLHSLPLPISSYKRLSGSHQCFFVSQDIELIQFQLAEQQSEDLPESVTFEEWKTDVASMDEWFKTIDEKCSHVNISRDSASLKKGEQDTKTILMEFNDEGKPRFNKIIVLGRRLIDEKNQTPEEEQEITITITKFTKRIIEVERVVELHRIRLVNLYRLYCRTVFCGDGGKFFSLYAFVCLAAVLL